MNNLTKQMMAAIAVGFGSIVGMALGQEAISIATNPYKKATIKKKCKEFEDKIIDKVKRN